jgi:hypothetical protein
MTSKQEQLEKAERALYRAKARAEQASDRVSDCEREITRLTEEVGETPQKEKKLEGILIEVNGGVVTYVQFDGKPVATYHLFDWDELLGEGDTCTAWEGLSTDEQEFLRDRYPTEFTAIQERLEEEATSENQTQKR